jgi:hypothetical protein
MGKNLGWHQRTDWLYLTLGLARPLDKAQLRCEREAGKAYSSYGFELGLVTKDPYSWATQLLYLFLTHVTDGVQIKWGDRFAFGLREVGDTKLEPYTGNAEELGFSPFGELRAVLFWPFLFPEASFITSTGKAEIFIATGITQDEWKAAKDTTTAQLLLLLCRAGIWQRTDPVRQSVFNEDRWRVQWREIVAMGGEEAHRELDAGIGRWSPVQICIADGRVHWSCRGDEWTLPASAGPRTGYTRILDALWRASHGPHRSSGSGAANFWMR